MITNTKKEHIIAYLLLLLLTVLAVNNASAQGQAANWFFGNHTGLNIAESPYTMNGGAINSSGSSSSYSEPDGELKIYTDGQTIWNAKNLPVTEGTGILGSPDASQGVLMVKMPALPHFIFVFTTGINGDDSLRYTLVDIAAYNHLGQIDPVHKNIAITGPVEEKLTAVSCPNGDVWVLAHGYNTDEYIAIKLTGIQYPNEITPVISHIGNIDDIGGKGCMKFSPDGSKLARTMPFKNKVEYAKFDINTGQVSNMNTINNMSGCYGVEFSSLSNRMYVTTQGADQNFIHQFSINATNYSATINSKFSLIPPVGTYPAALQLGYNGVIYAANSQSNSLGVITNADTTGSNLIYSPIEISLTNTAYKGLPAFNQGYFNNKISVPTDIKTEAANVVEIFPNPSNGMFKLTIGQNKSEEVKLNIFNLAGAKIFSADKFEIGQKVIPVDLSKQPAGIYFFEVTTPEAKIIKRLVIN